MTFFISGPNCITILLYLIWKLKMLKSTFSELETWIFVSMEAFDHHEDFWIHFPHFFLKKGNFSILSFQMRYQSKVIQFEPEMKKVTSWGGHRILFLAFMQKISTLAQRAAETSKNKVTRQRPISLKLLYLSGIWVKKIFFLNLQLTIPQTFENHWPFIRSNS